MSGTTLRRLRLASQVFFFLLFVLLLIRTEFPGSVRSAGPDVHVPYPVGIFLEPDPLVAARVKQTEKEPYQCVEK